MEKATGKATQQNLTDSQNAKQTSLVLSHTFGLQSIQGHLDFLPVI